MIVLLVSCLVEPRLSGGLRPWLGRCPIMSRHNSDTFPNAWAISVIGSFAYLLRVIFLFRRLVFLGKRYQDCNKGGKKSPDKPVGLGAFRSRRTARIPLVTGKSNYMVP